MRTISAPLDLIRRLLISHYDDVETKDRLVDTNSSKDDIYDYFIRLFSGSKDESHDMVLDFIPDIYAKLSKGENSENLKRPRSKSRMIPELLRRLRESEGMFSASNFHLSRSLLSRSCIFS